MAIFAAGLVLAAHRASLSHIVIIGALILLALQPTLFLLTITLLDLTGPLPGATIVASAFPNATIAILFAQQYRTAQAETASIMLVSTLGLVAAIPMALAASSHL